MAQHGGYRKPGSPAAVSGPGAHSRRTDGQPITDMPDAQYGENQTFTSLQQGAPLASAGGAPAGAPSGGAPVNLTPLDAPTAQPDVPITHGADYGPGASSSILGLGGDPNRMDAKALAAYKQWLIMMSTRDDTLPSVRSWIRAALSNM